MKKILAFLMVGVMCLSMVACGNKDKEKDKIDEAEKNGSYTFFYTEDLTEKDVDAMMHQLEKRLEALGQKDYVSLTSNLKEKQIEVSFTDDAEESLVVSAFCINDFAIKDKDGNVIVTQEDVKSVETYYVEGEDKEKSAGFLHFLFNDDGAKKMETATSNRTDGENVPLVFCLNGETVNEVATMEIIKEEMYASGFGNLLDLFQVCITEGPLPVSLYSTTSLFDGQESVIIEGNESKEDIDYSQITPDGYITMDEETENTETETETKDNGN